MIRVWLPIVALLLAFQSHAATLPTPLTPDCRYLFIVDTSLSMARLQEGVNNALYRMVATGLGGQMAPGEVFTVWTFNEDVQQREFPLNSWTAELNQSMGNRVLQFMQTQRYRRNANMRALINSIYQAKQTCPRLAVFLISNGQEVLVGTPFDRNINVSYGRRFEELRAARVPFLTTLLCKNGNFVGWSVSAANEPVTLPRGPDGEFVVGREKQKSISLPPPSPSVVKAPTNSTPAVIRPAATNKLKSNPTMTVKPRTNTVAKMTPNTPPSPKAKAIPVQPVPPPNKRPTIDLTPKTKKPDNKSPRVVKPTEIAPDNRVKLTSASFTKTNKVLKGKTLSNPVETTFSNTNRATTNKTVVTKKPATNVVKVAKAPQPATIQVKAAKSKPSVKPAIKKPEPKKPEPKKTKPEVSKLVETVQSTSKKQTPKAAPETKSVAEPVEPIRTVDAVTNDNTKVVTRFIYVTQVVNVAMPGFKERPKPEVKKPVKPAGPHSTERVNRVMTDGPVSTATNDVAAVAGKNQNPDRSRPSFVATPTAKSSATEQPFAAVPKAAPAPARDSTALGTVSGGNGYTRWIYLAVGVLLIILASLTAIRVFDRPGGTTYISQSMTSRDNGSRSGSAGE